MNDDVWLLLFLTIDANFQSAQDPPGVQCQVVLPAALQVVKLLVLQIDRPHEAMIFERDTLWKCAGHVSGSLKRNGGLMLNLQR